MRNLLAEPHPAEPPGPRPRNTSVDANFPLSPLFRCYAMIQSPKKKARSQVGVEHAHRGPNTKVCVRAKLTSKHPFQERTDQGTLLFLPEERTARKVTDDWVSDQGRQRLRYKKLDVFTTNTCLEILMHRFPFLCRKKTVQKNAFP